MINFEIVEEETDLWISMEASAFYPGLEEEIRGFVLSLRESLKDYLALDPGFLTSLEPCEVLQEAPPIAAEMARAVRLAGVGPMAAVAGAFARDVGRFVRSKTSCSNVVVENGGDIYIYGNHPITAAVYAGSSPLSDKIGLRLRVDGELGICTSSGTVGHSLSFGRADACVVICDDVLVADAFATAFCNRVKFKEDVQLILDAAREQQDIRGALVIIGDALGAWGKIELVSLE